MNLTRTFHAIGQGAFCSEAFYDDNGFKFNVVYDCGSYSTDKHLKIDAFAKNCSYIDILFISHFHADHINGVKRLTENTHIKTIVIPYMDYTDKLLAIGAAGLYEDIIDVILDPSLFVRRKSCKETKIIEITSTQEEGQVLDINTSATVGSGRVFTHSNIPNWFFIPSHIKDESSQDKQKQFIDRLTKEGIDILNSKNWEKQRKKIATIYRDIFGVSNINNTSLLLYSGSNTRSKTSTGFFKNSGSGLETICKSCQNVFQYVGDDCLYMGDIEITDGTISSIQSIYKLYLHNIGHISVSHHGSTTANKAEFYNDLKRNKCAITNAVISYGIVNNYGHPAKETLVTLINSGLHIKLVTNKSADYISEYTIHTNESPND